MFKNWGFLLGEIWVLILLAALLGLFAGWLIWGRRTVQHSNATLEHEQALSDLKSCRLECQMHEEEIARLKWDIEAKDALSTGIFSQAETVAQDSNVTGSDGADYDGDGHFEGTEEGVKPATLEAPRDGKGDDLKMIKGVGAKMEELCHSLGFYHFDQIANWTADEVAWVDANLEGFKGRVSRDDWVAQARLLAKGEETEFSKRVKEGGVYHD